MTRLGVFAIACWLSACSGTETGNPFTGEMRADAHSSDPAEVDIQAGAISVEQAWLSTEAIELITADECDRTEGPSADPPSFGTADHAGPGNTRVELELVEDDYCRARLPLSLAADPLPSGAPAELSGRSIVIVGTVTDPGIPFVIAAEIDRVVDIRAIDGSFEMTEANGSVFLGFDVATWLAGLDIASGAADGDGVVVIDSTSNSDLLTGFEANLDSGIELYRDDDRDGIADPAEQLLARGQPE